MRRAFVLAVSFLTLGVFSSFADVITAYKRITTIDEVLDDAKYIFVAIDSKGVGFMLTEESADGKRLIGKNIGVLSTQIEESSDFVCWKIRKSTDGFNIISAKDGEYLGNKSNTTNLTKSKTPYSWSLSDKDSLFLFSCSDNPNRILSLNYGFETNHFGAYISAIGYLNITLYKETIIDIPPSDSVETEYGLKVLKGGWTKECLANVDFRNITELDLTGIDVFPLSTLPFNNMEEQSNTVIYIKESQKSKINDSWKNVVLCADEGNRLLRPMVLDDKHPFRISRSFHVGKDSIVYTRHFTDNYWQTLFLPFASSESDKDIIVKGIDRIENDTLVLSSREKVKAHDPLLIRYDGGDTNFAFTFKSQEQILMPDSSVYQNESLIGTLQGIETTESDKNIFMLDTEGKNFVLTSTGSWIYPFRCYLLLMNNSSKSIRIDGDELLSIANQQKDSHLNTIYDVYGRKVSIGKKWGDISSYLPNGIYIENNIKRKK